MDKFEEKINRRKAISSSLESNRFKLSREPEQMEKIKKIREIANEAEVNHPEFVSFQIFGSLIKGYAKNESDIDIYLIVDEDKIEREENDQDQDAREIAKEKYLKCKNLLNHVKGKMMVNMDLSEEQVKDVSLKIISENRIKESLTQAPWTLYFLFYPSVGTTKIRYYRKIVFNELKNHGERGERMWQSIMDRLALTERGAGLGGVGKNRKLYPQTLEDGEKRFL